MYRLSVCADSCFRQLPFKQRVERIVSAGFLVEFWGWTNRDVDWLAADPKIKIGTFSGHVGGSIVHPDGVETYLEGVRRTLPVAKKLACRELLALTGELSYAGEVIHPIADHPATMWITAYKSLCRMAELAEQHDVIYNLEPLNTVLDHPGYPLARPMDAVNLLREVGSPRIKILLDIYHTQMQQGNVIQFLREYADMIGYIHVADVPGRREPGTGEINYPMIASTLKDIGYQGVVGLEAFPDGNDEQALTRFRETFQ